MGWKGGRVNVAAGEGLLRECRNGRSLVWGLMVCWMGVAWTVSSVWEGERVAWEASDFEEESL